MKHIYLDHAAATPVAREVESEMKKHFRKDFGNAGSVHRGGQKALAALDAAREELAASLDAKFYEIIFTASATEANNLALRGTVRAFRRAGKKERPHVIISAIEHSSVYGTARDLEEDGEIALTIVPVDTYGCVDIRKIEEALTPETILVSIIYASNEIGTIEPITEIGAVIKNYREEQGSMYPLFHTDAVQAFQFCDMNVGALGVDMLSLSAQKIYGPKGAAALYIKEATQPYVRPVTTGGSQEFGFRAATENTAAIAGFGVAARLVREHKTSEAVRIRAMRDALWRGLKKAFPKAELNGAPLRKDGACQCGRLPNNLSVSFPGVTAMDMVVRLDMAGISASPGSACSARAAKPSRVIEALCPGSERAKESVRFSLGRTTVKADIDEALRRIQDIVRS